MREYPISVAAGKTVNLTIVGDYLNVKEAQGDLRVDFSRGRQLQLSKGSQVEGLAFDVLRIENLESVDQQIVLVIGDGGERVKNASAVEIVNAVSIKGDVSSFRGLATITSSAQMQALLIAANEQRKKLVLIASKNNTGDVYVNHDWQALPAEPQGVELVPGMYFEVDCSNAIKLLFMESGNKVFVSEVIEGAL